MKFRLSGTVDRLNIEHRIMMALRFIYLKKTNPAKDVV